MKDTGKKFKGVKVYTDPNVPKGNIYLMNTNLMNIPPKRSGKITGIYEPPPNSSWWERIKWHLNDT